MKTPRLLGLAAALAAAATLATAAGPGGPAAAAPAKKPVRHARVAATPSRADMAVPFIDDDYTKALAQARARKVPLFIEAWAPW